MVLQKDHQNQFMVHLQPVGARTTYVHQPITLQHRHLGLEDTSLSTHHGTVWCVPKVIIVRTMLRQPLLVVQLAITAQEAPTQLVQTVLSALIVLYFTDMMSQPVSHALLAITVTLRASPL